MRQIISTAATAVIVSLLTLTVAGAMAQSDPDPERAAMPTGTNADRVDGRHAVGFTNKRGRRAGKLVATNKGGWLPSNIVQPYWGYIKNKPGILADHQISWNEVVGKPAAFADGVDDTGVTKVQTTRELGNTVNVAAGSDLILGIQCPVGSSVVGGGYNVTTGANPNLVFYRSSPEDSRTWAVGVKNLASAGSAGVEVSAVCLSVEPSSALKTATKTIRPTRLSRR